MHSAPPTSVTTAEDASTDWGARIALEQAVGAADPRYAPIAEADGPSLGDASLGAAFDTTGARVALGDHQAHFRALAITRGASRRELSFVASPVIDGVEVRTDRGGGVTEWWRSLPSGLEHGVTLEERMAGEGELEIEIGTGALAARLVSDDAIELCDVGGTAVARYAHLIVTDAGGQRVPARMTVRDGRIALAVTDAGAGYPLLVDPLLVATEEATLVASDGAAGDRFGTTMALTANGSRAIVGAVGGTGAGRVRVFRRTGLAWTEEAQLAHSAAGVAPGFFGASVALSGDGSWALVGVPGANGLAGVAVVFRRRFVMDWTEEATLVAESADPSDLFGVSVALNEDGTCALVGARDDDTGGSATVFRRGGGGWTREATLRPSDGAANAQFGLSVAISSDGSRALVGAPYDTTPAGANAGTARVFAMLGTTWTEEATLMPATAAMQDRFGGSVALSGNGMRAVVGAIGGGAWAFASAGTWTEETELVAADLAVDSGFGGSVSLSSDGSRALVGALSDGPAMGPVGTARLFSWTGTSWAEAAILVRPAALGVYDEFGEAVALSGDGTRALVGAPQANASAGNARVYRIAVASSNGAVCTDGVTCLSGSCVDGVCCNTACGGGATDDCQACSAALTGGVSGVCAPLSAGIAPTVLCHSSAAACDADAVCSSTSTECPPIFAPAGTACRASGSPCDAAELCTGASAACPDDAAAAAGFPCRPSAGACDAPEACDGSSYACPGDGRIPSGVVCRSAVAGGCDLEETCDGTSVACPTDSFVAAATVCRAAVGPCDVEDRCSGTSGVCVDLFATGITCRVSAGPCDVADECDGTGATCPTDGFVAAGTECAPSGGEVCDAPDVCTGTSADCVMTYLSGVECRASTGGCDPAEVCAGSSTTCPPDQVSPSGTVCRASTDMTCDTAEACDGTASSCPADVTSCVPTDAGPVTGDAGAPVAATGCACRAGRHGWDRWSLGALAGLLALIVTRRRAR